MGGKKTKTGQNRKKTVMWFFIMVVFFIELFGNAWCRVQCVRIGYETSKEAQRYQKLVKLHNSLKIEVARLKSPERISGIAKKRLFMIAPSLEQTILIQ